MQVLLLIFAFPAMIEGFSANGLIRGSGLVTTTPSMSVASRHAQKRFARPPQDSDEAFENLKKEIDDFQDIATNEMATKSKQVVNRYFDLFSGMNRDFSTSDNEVQYNERELRKQRDLANKVIDFAVELGQDLSSLDLEGTKGRSNRKSPNKTNLAKRYAQSQGTPFEPNYSIKDDETMVMVVVELPGVDIEDVDIAFDEKTNVLIINGYRQSLASDENVQFSERFELGLDIEAKNIGAKMEKGILTVTVPKKKTTETTRRITIVPGN